MNNTEYTVKWYREKRKNPHIDKICIGCLKPFKTYIHRIKYCSSGCVSSKPAVQKNCLYCDKKFTVRSYRIATAKYCTVSCGSKNRTGENAANWQGGKTSIADNLRTSIAYKAWRRAVFERDNYTCVGCGDDTGGNLEADHIKPRSLFPELTLDVDNGRTLCTPCHKQTSTWGRKLFTYRKQLA